MRRVLGIGILAVGLLSLGWWAQGHDAPRIESKVRKLAETAVAGTIHGMTVEVSGRDIHVIGIADGQVEAEALLENLNALPARRVVTSDLKVLETAAPFTLQITKNAASYTAIGHVPTEALRAEMAATLQDAAAGLTLAAGAPKDWGDMAKAGMTALGALNKGTLSLTDSVLNISGEAAGPQEAAAVDAALNALPSTSVTKKITLLDDGTPAAWVLTYDATSGAAATGKLPKGLDLATVATAMGLPEITGAVAQAITGKIADAGAFAPLKDRMPLIETLEYSQTPDAQTLNIGVQGGVDGATLQKTLAEGLPGVAVTVSTIAARGENGALRVNAATGVQERFMGGFWLAVPQLEVGLQGCQAAADGILKVTTITFVTGSDQLDASALRVINDLAAIMARCTDEARLKAVIGGHTDNVGDAVSNLGLSQRRAAAVRREMVARGVPAESLQSVGFGDTQPIADNGTNEGRAKNRRTTVQWSQ